MEFPTLILGVPLIFAVLTYEDWFPTILLIVVGQESSTKGSKVSYIIRSYIREQSYQVL